MKIPLNLLKNKKLLWGPKFFCSDLHVTRDGMRTRAAVICVSKHQWVEFKATRSSSIDVKIMDYPSRKSGYPDIEIDLNPLKKVTSITVRRVGQKTKAVVLRIDKKTSVTIKAEDFKILPYLQITIRGF